MPGSPLWGPSPTHWVWVGENLPPHQFSLDCGCICLCLCVPCHGHMTSLSCPVSPGHVSLCLDLRATRARPSRDSTLPSGIHPRARVSTCRPVCGSRLGVRTDPRGPINHTPVYLSPCVHVCLVSVSRTCPGLCPTPRVRTHLLALASMSTCLAVQIDVSVLGLTELTLT